MLINMVDDCKTRGELSCFVCGALVPLDQRQLKRHLLRAHAQQHFCLFCVEKKSWSDEFVSQAAYHAHYQVQHSGLIERRRKERQEHKRKEADARKEEASAAKQQAAQLRKLQAEEKGKRHPNSCQLCASLPVFSSGYERDQHLLREHGFDICNICKLIGPGLSISVHIAISHPDVLCYLCGSLSPYFRTPDRVRAHLTKSHPGASDSLTCLRCSDSLPRLKSFVIHARDVHGCSSRDLRRAKRQRHLPRSPLLGEWLLRLRGLVNTSHKECHILAVLQLLSQTSLPDILLSNSLISGANCTDHAVCRLRGFYTQYRAQGGDERSKRNLEPFLVTQAASDCFGGDLHPRSVAELTRTFIKSSATVVECDAASSVRRQQVVEQFCPRLEWRLDCPGCGKFSTAVLADPVLRLRVGHRRDRLAGHLERLLSEQTCSCSHQLIGLQPCRSQLPNYLILELDRRAMVDGETEESDQAVEMRVYSMKLEDTYDICGKSYTVFATVSLGLDFAESGHFSTTFHVDSNQLIKIHETSIEAEARGPWYDSATVLVCLKQVKPGGDLPPAVAFLPERKPVASTCLYNVDEESTATQACYLELGELSTAPALSTLAYTIPVTSSESESPSVNVTEEDQLQASLTSSSMQASLTSSSMQASLTSSSMPRYNQYGYRFKQQPNKMLAGDNLALFLNSDPDVVNKYRQQYHAAAPADVAPTALEDVSLRGLGNAVLESQTYRVKSAARCKALRRRLAPRLANRQPEDIDCDTSWGPEQTDRTQVTLNMSSQPFTTFDT